MSRLIGYEQNVLTLLNLIKSITRKHKRKTSKAHTATNLCRVLDFAAQSSEGSHTLG